MIRECKSCHKMVDFSEPWCDHETMEESAWLDIHERMVATATTQVLDEIVYKAAQDLMGHVESYPDIPCSPGADLD